MSRRSAHAALARALAAALLATWAGACGASTSSEFLVTNPAPQPLAARAAETVEVLDSAPGRAYAELGLVEVLDDVEPWDDAAKAEARSALRARAAAVGCDAVVVLGEIDWIYVVESAGSTTERHGLRGVCIQYR
ncbi:hypothetical protein [Haliangium ochraceum]|uniref:Lipoprotein n=1 Tax=Haliangium ochraceum (strain DSM 14365 / JCM 11303 / SMP-2) TaxID=502025 RepID=D0LZS2_HALO1|nr:hypothetical protein [Haliangium ochraceum]ACY18051.1 hypothetical protein Hoch_5569 [Haliangium ochraceum DSM 14365]